tara:strand:+ start:396 stop:1352 length:957 start_codon:yes stop_codon:yes gene_type:complete
MGIGSGAAGRDGGRDGAGGAGAGVSGGAGGSMATTAAGAGALYDREDAGVHQEDRVAFDHPFVNRHKFFRPPPSSVHPSAIDSSTSPAFPIESALSHLDCGLRCMSSLAPESLSDSDSAEDVDLRTTSSKDVDLRDSLKGEEPATQHSLSMEQQINASFSSLCLSKTGLSFVPDWPPVEAASKEVESASNNNPAGSRSTGSSSVHKKKRRRSRLEKSTQDLRLSGNPPAHSDKNDSTLSHSATEFGMPLNPLWYPHWDTNSVLVADYKTGNIICAEEYAAWSFETSSGAGKKKHSTLINPICNIYNPFFLAWWYVTNI